MYTNGSAINGVVNFQYEKNINTAGEEGELRQDVKPDDVSKMMAKTMLATKVEELICLMEWPDNQKDDWKEYSRRAVQETDLQLEEYRAAIETFKQIEL